MCYDATTSTLWRRTLVLVTALAVLLVGSGTGAQAAALDPGDDLRRPATAQIPASAGFIQVDDNVRYLDTADGRWIVDVDEQARQMTVTSPEGEAEYFGPAHPIWTETTPVANANLAKSFGGSVTAASNSTACSWAVWFIGVIHTSSWYAAVGMLALNPPAAAALTAIVTLGYGAFWNWVSMQC